MKHSVVSGAPKSRFVPMAWGAGALASVVMVLGVNGTLSSWTQAVINNDPATAESALAVALSESDGSSTCDTVAETSNSVVSCTIDLYGGTATPLAPAGNTSQSQDIVFTNTGTGDAASLKVTPGTCSGGDICTTTGGFTVALSCKDGNDYDLATGAAFTDLKWSAAAPSTQVAKTHSPTAAIEPGAQIVCRVTVAVVSGAPASISGQTASQALTWTLDA